MERGIIVLTPFPFTDLTTVKRRPAIVVSKYNKHKQDVIVAFISSKIPNEIDETDLIIDEKEKGFKLTGLHKSSLVKLDKLVTIEKDLVVGELGYVCNNVLKEINKRLKLALDL